MPIRTQSTKSLKFIGNWLLTAIIAFPWFLIPSVSWGGIMLDGVAESSYLNYGAQSQFAATGRLTGGLGPGSGTLIASDWVLSAGHVGNATTFQPGGVGPTYSVSQVIYHPQFVANGSNIGYGFDLALYKLSSPVPGVTPASIYRGTSEVTATGSITGFGVGDFGSNTSIGLTPMLLNVQRAGTNVIDYVLTFDNGGGGQVGAVNAAFLTDFDAPSGFGAPGQYNSLATFGSSVTPTSLEYHVANQDSGGGVYVFEGGQWWLAGINSGVVSQQGLYSAFSIMGSGNIHNFGYGAGGLYTRVSSFQNLIDQNVDSLPEPSSLLLLAMVACSGVVARRRRYSPRG